MADKRRLKFLTILWLLCVSYAFFHHHGDQTHIQRFPSMFAAFVQMWSMGYIDSSVIESIPLLTPIADPIPSGTSDTIRILTIMNAKYPFLFLLHAIVVVLTGIAPHTLITLPIGVFIMPAIILAIGRTYLPDYYPWLVAYLLIYLLNVAVFQIAYVSAFAISLLFLVILCLKLAFDGVHPKRQFGLVLASLLTVVNYWHTAALLTILLIICVTACLSLIGRFDRERVPTMTSNALKVAVICVVFVATFIRIWDLTYVALALVKMPIFLQELIYDFAGLFDEVGYPSAGGVGGIGEGSGSGGSEPVDEYAFDYRDNSIGNLYFYTHLGIHAVAGLLVLLPVAYYAVRRRLPNSHHRVLAFSFATGVGFAQAIFSVLYARSAFGLWLVPLVFIIFGAYAITTLDNPLGERIHKRIIPVTFSVLIVFAVVLTGVAFSTNELGRSSVTVHEDVDEPTYWLVDYMDGDTNVIMDFNIYSKFVYYEATVRKPEAQLQHLNVGSYAVLVGDAPVTDEYAGEYVVVDRQTLADGRPIHIYKGRGQLEPRPRQIENAKTTDKIRADGRTSIHKFHGMS